MLKEAQELEADPSPEFKAAPQEVRRVICDRQKTRINIGARMICLIGISPFGCRTRTLKVCHVNETAFSTSRTEHAKLQEGPIMADCWFDLLAVAVDTV